MLLLLFPLFTKRKRRKISATSGQRRLNKSIFRSPPHGLPYPPTARDTSPLPSPLPRNLPRELPPPCSRKKGINLRPKTMLYLWYTNGARLNKRGEREETRRKNPSPNGQGPPPPKARWRGVGGDRGHAGNKVKTPHQHRSRRPTSDGLTDSRQKVECSRFFVAVSISCRCDKKRNSYEKKLHISYSTTQHIAGVISRHRPPSPSPLHQAPSLPRPTPPPQKKIKATFENITTRKT